MNITYYFITVSCRGMCNFIVAQNPVNITKHKKSMDNPQPLARDNPIDKLPSHPPILLAPFIIPVAVERISTGNKYEFSTFSEFHEKTDISEYKQQIMNDSNAESE